MKRHVLIDGDVVVYRFAHGAQEVTKWSEDMFTIHARLDPAKVKLDGFIAELLEQLEAQSYTMVLSDIDKSFRYDLMPEYKAGRGDAVRPLLFRSLREHLLAEHAAVVWPNLEGDDVLGILLTRPPKTKGLEVVCATIDKDLRTVPGRHYNFDKPDEGVVVVPELDADRFWMEQTLTGDKTDGYPGCPKIGPVRAKKLLDDVFVDPVEYDPKWVAKHAWPVVVAAYEKAGLNETVALANARCARILRDGEYNLETGEVTLWQP